MSISYFEEMIETSEKKKRNLEVLTDSNLFIINIGRENIPNDIEFQFYLNGKEAKKLYLAIKEMINYLAWDSH